MPKPKQKSVTFSRDFIKNIEEFIDKDDKFYFTSVPEVMRFAWYYFIMNYELIKPGNLTDIGFKPNIEFYQTIGRTIRHFDTKIKK